MEELLKSIAETMGFGSFNGMVLFFIFLLVIAFIGVIIYKGQKGGSNE